jgi:hypothetical protein
VLIGAGLALLLAINSVARIGLFPPSLHDRHLQIASASTHVLVDSPQSKTIDLQASTADMAALTTRAQLLGNLMASPPVREYIARHAGVPADRIAAIAPVTVGVPRALTEPGSEKRASDLLASTDQYRLDIQSNPTVPILNVYAQAPSTDAAERLANGAVDGLREYLDSIASQQRVQPPNRVALLQLGRATGGVINHGIDLELALLTFFVIFAISCGAVLFIARVRNGWNAAGQPERTRPVAPVPPPPSRAGGFFP